MSDPNSGLDGAISNNSGQAINVISVAPDEGSFCFFPGNGGKKHYPFILFTTYDARWSILSHNV